MDVSYKPDSDSGKQLPQLHLGKTKTKLRAIWLEYSYLLLCMAIPALLIYFIYLAREIHPFGNGCVLVLDLNGQYVWFFEALRNFVRGDASLLYSFSRALGGEFMGIYAYYLASPLSFLVCLFPKDCMLEALLTLFLLKAAICGGTFGFYMHKTLKSVNKIAIIAFSVFYALTSYAIVQQHNTMWIDAVMWLPLITLGIEQLIKYGKFKLYTVSLAITLFSNFYIGYMVCIYCLLYFFLYYLAHGGTEARNNPLHEKKHFGKSLFRMAFFSMIAIGISAVILLSAYYSLNFGKTTFSDPSWEWTVNFDILELLYKFLPGSYDTVRPEGLPFLYCGVLTLLLLPAYFLSDKFPIRQKVISGIFIFIFVASFSISVVDLIWHCFQKPNWLNFRYSFMLCFYLCVLACRAFSEFKTVSLKSVMATGGLIALLCVILQKYTDGEYVEPNDYTCIWFTLLAIFAYLAILGAFRKATDKQLVSIVFLIAVSTEVFLNGLWNLNALDEDVGYSRYSYYNDFLDQTRPLVEAVQKSDTSFYRMEKTYSRKTNDNMALGIRGLSGSTSTLNKETIKFLEKMGYASLSHWSKYLGGTPVNDSLLGLKYILSDDDIWENYYEVYETDTENGYTAYYNPYALSIAYGVADDILDFPLGFVESMEPKEEEEEKSKISEAIAALKEKLNEWFDIDETVNSAEYEDDYNSPFERLNAMVTAMLGETETVKIFVPVYIDDTDTENLSRSYIAGHYSYTPIYTEKDSTVTYTLEMPVDAELFFYAPSKYPREVELSLEKDGSSTDMGTFFANETTRIVSLGMQEAGQEISLHMTLKKDILYLKAYEESFYYIDWDVFEDVMARLATDQYQITDYTESSFEGSFTASREHELVLTTIAFDKGWKVYVDGKAVETTKALGSLVAFYIDGNAGETHTVEIVYSPNTFYIGLTVSLISFGFLVLIIALEKKIRRVPVLRTLVGVPQAEEGVQEDNAPLRLPSEWEGSNPVQDDSQQLEEPTDTLLLPKEKDTAEATNNEDVSQK